MVLDLMTNVGVGFVIGAVSGAFGAFMGWNSSGEAFISRKFITGLATGIVAGISLVFANLLVFQTVTDQMALLIIYGDIFGGALAATWGVPKIADAIRPEPTATIK